MIISRGLKFMEDPGAPSEYVLTKGPVEVKKERLSFSFNFETLNFEFVYAADEKESVEANPKPQGIILQAVSLYYFVVFIECGTYSTAMKPNSYCQLPMKKAIMK